MPEIELFAKICISIRDYKRANAFIINNINNEGIKANEKNKLRKLQQSVMYAIRKEKALNMLLNGTKDTRYISNQTGVLETDVIGMKKRISGKDKFRKKGTTDNKGEGRD